MSRPKVKTRIGRHRRPKVAEAYDVTGYVGVDPLAPQATRIEGGYIIGLPEDGGWTLKKVPESGWKKMPHVVLANIPTYDAQGNLTRKPEPGLRIDSPAAEKFVQTYGGFGAVSIDENCNTTFKQEIAKIAECQHRIRRVWLYKRAEMSSNRPPSRSRRLSRIQADLRGLGLAGLATPELAARLTREPKLTLKAWDFFHVQAELEWRPFEIDSFNVKMFCGPLNDKVNLTAKDLWTFIRYLFIRDFVAKKTGFCRNPDCSSPYYLKKRRDQKYCSSDCSEYAQGQYALKWWRKHRKGRCAKNRR